MSAVVEISPDHSHKLRHQLDAQRRAGREDLPVPLSVRQDRLDRAIAMLIDGQDALCDAMWNDFGGRPKSLSRLTDLVAPVTALRYARKHVRRWMRPEKRKVEFPLNLAGARARVEYQPKGVVGIMSPWNYPVALAFTPLAGALAAGNRVMLKPSERTPETAEVIRAMIGRRFDPGEISVVTGGPEVGAAFSALPFDHLVFTGGTGVGRQIMAGAAPNLTPLTLELGGKSPALIGESARLRQAAERIVLGKMMNAGQTCLAPDYLLVTGNRTEQLVAALTASAGHIYPQTHGNEHLAQLIDERHAARVADLVAEAETRGTRVIRLQQPAGDRRMPLTLLVDPAPDLAVMREEIFGPVLPIVSCDDIDAAIGFVNDRPRPLGLYYFGEDAAERRRVLDRTVSGGVTLNDVFYHVTAEDLPFGGIGASGMGAYHGRDGFREFSHARAVYRQSRFNLAALGGLIPPYGKRLQRMVDMKLRR